MNLEFFSLIGLFFLITAVFPVIFWILFFSYQDRKEPEPKKMVVKVFLWGIIVAFLAITFKKITAILIFEETLSFTKKYLFYSLKDLSLNKSTVTILFLSAMGEEILKFFVLFKIIFNKKVFNQIIDGVVYGTTLALGFSFVENSLYFFEFFQKLDQASFFLLAFLRGIVSVLIHVCATGIIGFYLGKFKFKRKNKLYFLLIGLLGGILIHGIFNILLQFNSPFNYISYVLLVISFALLLIGLQKKQAKIIHKINR
ncbi:MAG: PrsW family intramembrane metalloprotease [Candidatus Moranbacteria bacterium]|nr:PrsW family intramembrane metalloprotease [Candidatus Moranbacteria bacterium]